MHLFVYAAKSKIARIQEIQELRFQTTKGYVLTIANRLINYLCNSLHFNISYYGISVI
jgi:hypothetical protein